VCDAYIYAHFILQSTIQMDLPRCSLFSRGQWRIKGLLLFSFFPLYTADMRVGLSVCLSVFSFKTMEFLWLPFIKLSKLHLSIKNGIK
jgi:hypothetical protein